MSGNGVPLSSITSRAFTWLVSTRPWFAHALPALVAAHRAGICEARKLLHCSKFCQPTAAGSTELLQRTRLPRQQLVHLFRARLHVPLAGFSARSSAFTERETGMGAYPWLDTPSVALWWCAKFKLLPRQSKNQQRTSSAAVDHKRLFWAVYTGCNQGCCNAPSYPRWLRVSAPVIWSSLR